MISNDKKLINHIEKLKQTTIAQLCTTDENRSKKYCLQLDALRVDLSRNYITEETIDLFIKWSEKLDIKQQIQDMIQGKKINHTEKRAVLHTALRDPHFQTLNQYEDQEINNTKERIKRFVDQVRSGAIKSYNNKTFIDVVNIGIGGSHLGVQMGYYALRNTDDLGIKLHFIANIDAMNLHEVMKEIDIERTLFIISSKTFTTEETLQNAQTVKNIIVSRLGEQAINSNFLALSENKTEAKAFGITEDKIFPLWDFIGGRYSLWGATGLPLALSIGSEKFSELLQGAYVVDQHFQNSELSNNIPFLLGVVSIINNNFLDIKSHAIIPYDYRLRYLTQYLQQLIMESNGKSVNKLGDLVNYNTAPVVFGNTGTNDQHSLFQLLHQGTQQIACDLIFCLTPDHNYSLHHDQLFANLIAQSEALVIGAKSVNSSYKRTVGNKPNTIILLEQLSPKTLGMLCSLYEHSTFIQSCFWEINAFDQWGVELGKNIAKNNFKYIQNKNPNIETLSYNKYLMDLYIKSKQ